MIPRDFTRVFFVEQGYNMGKELKQRVDIGIGNSAGFLVLPLPQAANSKGGGDERARGPQGWRHLEAHLDGSGITLQAQAAKASLDK